MTGAVIVAIAALFVFMICMILVLHPDYEDGLVGRICLAMMAMAALARFLAIVDDGWYMPFNSIAFLLWIGLAMFLARHLYRFLRWRKCGEHDWRPAGREAVTGKR